MSQFGRFSSDGKEFIIENPVTPRPWINYLYNQDYFATISNHGGGISYLKSPLHGRITRYRINDVPVDRPGKYIYVKDRTTGQYWSLTWQPVGKLPENYRVIHGLGYTRADSRVDEIAGSAVFFVPPDRNMEVWKVKLENRSPRKRSLAIYAYVEFCLGHALIDLINQCDDQHFNRVWFEREINALFATKTYWVTETGGTQQQENKEWDQVAFLTSSLPVRGFETLRERFIGPFHNESNPEALRKDNLSNLITDFGNTVGALRVDMELRPNESAEVVFCLGVIPKETFEETKAEMANACRSSAAAEVALGEVHKHWDKILNNVRVDTPDRDLNTFLNYWTPYQARVAFDVGRLASFYYWGIGRGRGFRDTAQDILAVTISDPELVRERIALLARQMFTDGRVYHHFYRDGQGETTEHCDDPLWFILAVTEYIRETGAVEVLDQMEPFVDGEAKPILDHLLAVVDFAENRLGDRSLPIFGRGDWNDTLDYIGGDEGGESVWGGMFYVAMLNRLLELFDWLGAHLFSDRVRPLRDRIRSALDEHAWDGDWFIRAFGSGGRRIGSHENQYGRIFLNAQSWAVIAAIGDPERLIKAMDSAYSHLNTPFGPKICAPAFRQIDTTIGLVTRCVPGKKENAAVFLHPVTWAILAECMLGRGSRAFQYYQETVPAAIDSAVYQSEPYVYPQYVTSDEHPTAGMASHSWQTGTAAWMYRVMIDFFLGIRPTFQGLQIDPVIPSSWPFFKVSRRFRGTKYEIMVDNSAGLERGVKEVQVDGQPIQGNLIVPTGKDFCSVKVIMGKKESGAGGATS